MLLTVLKNMGGAHVALREKALASAAYRRSLAVAEQMAARTGNAAPWADQVTELRGTLRACCR